MGYQEIVYNREGYVATVVLNRPEAMNALTIETYAELMEQEIPAKARPAEAVRDEGGQRCPELVR